MLAIENNYADSIYIIVKGEFSLTKVVSFPVSDTTCKLTNGNMSGDFIKEMKLKSTKKSVHVSIKSIFIIINQSTLPFINFLLPAF